MSVSVVIILLSCILSFLAFSNQGLQNKLMIDNFYLVKKREYHRLLTSGLVHADIPHLAFNMFTLWFFGPPLESALGSMVFTLVYASSILMGSMVSAFLERNNLNYRALGASGGISGVMFGLILLNPFMMIWLMALIPMPAILYLIGFILYSAYGMRQISSIGHAAHLFGGLAGLIITFLVSPWNWTLVYYFVGISGLAFSANYLLRKFGHRLFRKF